MSLPLPVPRACILACFPGSDFRPLCFLTGICYMNLDFLLSASFHRLSLYPTIDLYIPDTCGFSSFSEQAFRFLQTWYANPLPLPDCHASFFPHRSPIYSTSLEQFRIKAGASCISVWENFWLADIPSPPNGPHQLVFRPPGVMSLALVLWEREFLLWICPNWSLWFPFFDLPKPCTSFFNLKFHVQCTI